MAKDNASIIYVAGKPFLSLQYPMVYLVVVISWVINLIIIE